MKTSHTLLNQSANYPLMVATGGNPVIPCDKCGSGSYFASFSGCSIKNLSRMETEIFKRVVLPDKIIAAQLYISVETVKKHFQNIRLKTGLKNKIEMAAIAGLSKTHHEYIN